MTLALALGLRGFGGLAALAALPAPSRTYWSFWESGGSGWTFLVLLAPAFVVSPGLLQKVYGARDARAVRCGVGVNALGLLLYAGVPVAIGMTARARFPGLASPELALPTLLADALAAMGGGVLCVLVLQLATGGRGFGGLSPAVFGLAVSTLAFLGSLALRLVLTRPSSGGA